jgi:hypothetical protein
VSNIDKFLSAYIECAIWSSTDDEGESLDRLSLDLDADSLAAMRTDCDGFMKANTALLDEACIRHGYSWERAGHDYWLTRNGHGTGYWDRTVLDAGGLGDALTEATRAWGEAYVYVRYDGTCLHYAA